MKRVFLYALAALTLVMCKSEPKFVNEAIPADKDVLTGKLDCGITYYIRANHKPEKQAEFYILHNVGAIQENDNQQGLAHFLEHMAFNGTKNFPDKKLMNWCESVGIKFGANLNAATGIESTIYNISNVPISRESVLDSCLLILHDWANFITLDDDEIDKERGVIIEELRTRNTADWRMMEKMHKYLFGDTKYAKRNVIGYIDSLKTFKHETLRDFYHHWYNTQNQCIVVVGDFDANKVLEKVKSTFADIKPYENAEAKEVIPIPDNDKPVVGIVSDPEATQTLILLAIKRKPTPSEQNNTTKTYVQNAMGGFISTMANKRLTEISQKPNAPFIMAQIGSGSITTTCDIEQCVALGRDGELPKAFEALYTEVERIRRHGFTAKELELVKTDAMRTAEQNYNNRNDRRNSEFINRYISNYQNNTPIPDADENWKLQQKYIPSITIDSVNALAKTFFTEKNQIVICEVPEKKGLAIPTENEITAVIEKVRAAKIDAYVDTTKIESLIPTGTMLQGSPVDKTETDKFGATVWTLKNGAKIVFKQTDFKADELVFSAIGTGGLSTAGDDVYYSGGFANGVVAQSGVGKFNMIELQKQLTGKSASVEPMIGDYSAGFSGSCSPKDAETMFQLLYLYFTQPRWDKKDFDVLINQMKSVLLNMDKNPDFVFQNELTKVEYNNNYRKPVFSPELFDKIKFEQMPDIYKKFFNNAADFTYVFVGNMKPEELRPLVEKYIGSLPASAQLAPKAKDDGTSIIKGEKTKIFNFKMETPKTKAAYVYSGEIPYSIENEMTMSALSQILRTRYTEVIREEKGGTYGVDVRGSIARYPKNGYALNIIFDTNKEQSEELMGDIVAEVKNMADKGPSDENISKVKEYLNKQHKDDLKENTAWAGWLADYYLYNEDFSDNEKQINAISAAKVKSFAAKIVKDNNVVKVVMNPE